MAYDHATMTLDARFRNPRLWIALECSFALLLISRMYVLNRLKAALSDVPQYVEYCWDYRAALEAGRPFYDFHREAVHQRLERLDPPPPPSVGNASPT